MKQAKVVVEVFVDYRSLDRVSAALGPDFIVSKKKSGDVSGFTCVSMCTVCMRNASGNCVPYILIIVPGPC